MPPKKETKEKILDAALELFSEKGFKATTTKIIAEKAEVNEVTLFRYFGSKEKLFFAVVDKEAEVRLDILQIELDPSENMVDELTMIGTFMAESMVKRASFFRLMVLEIDRYPELWERIGTVPMAAIAKLSQYFEQAKEKGLVRKDINTETMAVSFFSFIFRILVANAFLGDDLFIREKRDESMKNFAELFVNGIADRSD